HPVGVLHVMEDARRPERLEAGVVADEELGRPDPRLERAELEPLDHAWNRPELARRVDLGSDPPARPLFDAGAPALLPLVLDVVDGSVTDLERVGRSEEHTSELQSRVE